MKKTKEQEIFLMKELKIKQKIELEEAIQLMNLSESTVRRLFIRLEQKGLALRSHGGICLMSDSMLPSYDYEKVEIKSVSQKEKIANCAVEFLENKDIIYLDSGTTLAHFCNAIIHRLEQKTLNELTVFTNSLVNLNILKSVMKVNLIGGEFRNNRKDFCGYLAQEALKKLHFTKCFLGTDGYGKGIGFTATDFETARLNEIAVLNSEKRFVLMDSDKIFSPSVVSYADCDKISTVITDGMADEGLINTVFGGITKIILAK